jgi:hypothetical protein
MGAVTFSLDPALLECLRNAIRLEVFVETGTFEGATAELAAASFLEVHSVELSEEYCQRARERLAGYSSVLLHQGESPKVLRELRPRLEGRGVLFWLDAHWCDAGETAGVDSQCPLLHELKAIGRLNDESAVLIDDARLFLCPPPGAHRAEQWPSFDAIVRQLIDLSQHHELLVFNDVICFYPRTAALPIHRFALGHGFDWLRAADKSRGYDQMLAQLSGKDALISRLHAEASQLQQALAETHERLRHTEAMHRRTLANPVRLVGFYAQAVAKRFGRVVPGRKSA